MVDSLNKGFFCELDPVPCELSGCVRSDISRDKVVSSRHTGDIPAEIPRRSLDGGAGHYGLCDMAVTSPDVGAVTGRRLSPPARHCASTSDCDPDLLQASLRVLHQTQFVHVWPLQRNYTHEALHYSPLPD